MQSADQTIRMLNLGPTNWLRTQSVYRSTAQLIDEVGLDTVILCSPLHAYVTVPAGQDISSQLDLPRFIQRDIPVLNSQFADRVVLLDSNTFMFQWVFREGQADDLKSASFEALRQTFATLGVAEGEVVADQYLVGDGPLAEVHNAQIDDVHLLQGIFYFMMDYQLHAGLGLDSRVSGLWEKVTRPASPEQIHTTLLASFSGALGREIERGRPKQVETRLSKEIDLQLLEEAQTYLKKEIHIDPEH